MKLLLMITALLVGCGNGSSNSEVSQAELNGTWVSDCIPLLGISLKGTYIFTSAEDLTLIIGYYATDKCISPALTEKETRSYTFSDSAIEGALNWNLITKTYTRTYLNENEVAFANADAHFGYSDWAMGSEKDIAGKSLSSTSEKESAAGDPYYQILKVSGSTFRIGDIATGDGTTEAKRPVSLNTAFQFTKQ